MSYAASSTTVASLFVATLVCALPSVAHAQDGNAEALFKEGRALLDQKRYDEACPKLAESQRLEPGAGTLVALALCHEGQGKTATAHHELEEASSMGLRKGRDDLANAAQKRARAMEPKLSKILVRTNESDLVVRCDGEGIEAGKPVAVDPGPHKIEATAPGKVARSYLIRLTGAGLTEITVERLDDEPKAAIALAPAPAETPHVALLTTEPPPAGDASPPSTGTAQRVIGLSIAGAGVVGLGAGAYFGVRAIGESSDARKSTGAESTDAHDRAKKSFTTSVVSVAAGTGALTLGLILFATAPKATPKTSARIVPTGGPGDVGMGLAGTF